MNLEILEDYVKLKDSILTERLTLCACIFSIPVLEKSSKYWQKANTSRYLTRIHLNETLFHKSDSEQTGFPNPNAQVTKQLTN